MRTLANCMTWAGKDNTVSSAKIEKVSAIKAALSLTDEMGTIKYRSFGRPKMPGFNKLWELTTTPRLIEVSCITPLLANKKSFAVPPEMEPLVDFCLMPTAARDYYFQEYYKAKDAQSILQLVDAGLQTMFEHKWYKHWLFNVVDKQGKTILDEGYAINSAYVKNQIATEFSLNMQTLRKNTLNLHWLNIGAKHADIMSAAACYPKAHFAMRPKKKYMSLLIHVMFPHRRLYRSCEIKTLGLFTESHMQEIRKHMAAFESLGFSYSIATKVGIYLTQNMKFTNPPTERSYLGEKSMKAYRIPRPYFYYKRF